VRQWWPAAVVHLQWLWLRESTRFVLLSGVLNS
jgi:hypothetical protein